MTINEIPLITLLWTIYLCILLSTTIDLISNIFTRDYISQVWLLALKLNIQLPIKYNIIIVSLLWSIWYMYFLH